MSVLMIKKHALAEMPDSQTLREEAISEDVVKDSTNYRSDPEQIMHYSAIQLHRVGKFMFKTISLHNQGY